MPHNRLESYIQVTDRTLNRPFADAVLREYAHSQEWLPTSVQGGYYPHYRRCEGISILEPAVVGASAERKEIASRIVICLATIVQYYQYRHPNCHVSRVVGLQLLRYRPGGFYVQHQDASFENPRILTCVLGLNSNFAGGALQFLDNTIRVPLILGRSIVFPSNFMFPHAAEPVMAGVRYVIVSWVA